MKQIIPMILVLLFMVGCAADQRMDGDGMVNTYSQISQETAKEMMKLDDGHVIVDVRRQDEYNNGHIPGAILVPNESIGTEQPEALPDRNQIILVYCRSGRRSKEAAQKLFDLGYTNVYEFGGINDWTGEIVTGGKPTTLSFHSFDGGGPEYTIDVDSDIVSCQSTKEYADANHEELDGAGFVVIFTFTGIRTGETSMTVKERSPVSGNLNHVYNVKVDQNLNLTIEYISTEDLDNMTAESVLTEETQ